MASHLIGATFFRLTHVNDLMRVCLVSKDYDQSKNGLHCKRSEATCARRRRDGSAGSAGRCGNAGSDQFSWSTAQQRLSGIFTGRDAVRLLAKGKDAAATHLAKAMTPKPVTVAPDSRAIDALRAMSDGGFRHVPVTDNEEIWASYRAAISREWNSKSSTGGASTSQQA